MHADVFHVLEPPKGLCGEIAIAKQRAAMNEIVARVAHRPIHFALDLGAARAKRLTAKAPVCGEARELRIFEPPPPVPR